MDNPGNNIVNVPINIAPPVEPGQAAVNVTWAGQNGHLPDPVLFDVADSDVKAWVAEAIRTGGIPGIRADAAVDLTDFVVDRFAATEEVPYARLFVRPKTPFGNGDAGLGTCPGCGSVFPADSDQATDHAVHCPELHEYELRERLELLAEDDDEAYLVLS